ncbi:Glu-tRNA(Gln) amidotransferase subunit GatE [Candidatus Woesearchaeota archaeon]|nr:Glu-tRNA(Gln) amidotransferase subunit GatE [Candidatus Woesearchaeota archaeon]
MIDYNKLGFKCGIEIHQQLDTHKLFCNCPSEIRKDVPDFIIKRYLRASAGETGKIDIAAKHEQKKAKQFLYQGYDDTTCLVETDDEPPHTPNQEALLITLQVAKLLNAKIVDKIQFMRKVVIDGSNTSGFQRTALIARDGHIILNKKKIGISVILLEEEACQAIKRTKDVDTYNLSRLGIPLIEIATAPDIKSPQECQQVAEHLGMLLRSTGKAKRGIGTIRQDVNVSISKGERVEVKGFQDLKSIPKVIDYEIKRQLSLIKKHKKITRDVRKAEPDMTTSFSRPMPGASRMYPETDVKTIEVTDKLLKQIPHVKLIKDQIKEITKKYNLNKELSTAIIKKGIAIDKFTTDYPNIPAEFIAQTLINSPKELRKRYGLKLDIYKIINPIFEKLNGNKITREAVFELILTIAQGKKPNYNKYKPISEEGVTEEVKQVIAKNKGAPVNALMGILMSKYRGKIDGKKAMELIKKYS